MLSSILSSKRNKKASPTTPQRAFSNSKKFSKAELLANEKNNGTRWKQLLLCARANDSKPFLVLPTLGETHIPMIKVQLTLTEKVELLDIYHYLRSRQRDIRQKITRTTFGPLIGIELPRTTLVDILKREADYRAAVKIFPPDSKNIMHRKHIELELLIVEWIEEQKTKNVPVSGRMIRRAADITYTILADSRDDDDDADCEIERSFTASYSWFSGFKRFHGITHCKLQGEIASVDLVAIEPELVEIRELCSGFAPENIYNCDETGMYLKEQMTKTYAAVVTHEGAKAARDCRVSIMFCINATGSSLALSDRIPALKPFVIGKIKYSCEVVMW